MVEGSDELPNSWFALYGHHSCPNVYVLFVDGEYRGSIIKSTMLKDRVHNGHTYAFGGLITRMYRIVEVSEEILDYMAPLYEARMDITRTKGPDKYLGPILTSAK